MLITAVLFLLVNVAYVSNQYGPIKLNAADGLASSAWYLKINNLDRTWIWQRSSFETYSVMGQHQKQWLYSLPSASLVIWWS
jgi:hypothetical protein